VIRAIEFDSPERVPRDLWWLPAVQMTQKEELRAVLERFPMDIGTPDYKAGVSERQKGQPTMVVPGSHPPIALPRRGKYVDEWGSVWQVGEDGVVGEVKEPVLRELPKIRSFSPPWEYLESTDLTEVNRSCADSNQFMLSGICARPFERMQFVRGTENLLMDLAYGTKEIVTLREMVHEYNVKRIEMWLKTDVDGILMMDDWGAKDSLLISPHVWREFLRPLYAEYCDLIHQHHKYVFFHSDGYIEEVFGDVVEMGVDAINSQLFCMDIEGLGQKYKGKITFWGEIDRQRLLPFGEVRETKGAVRRVRAALEDERGGVIAQCEWGKNNPPENVEAVFKAWSSPSRR